jgi:cytochrome c biogenesis protein CcmG/thiol:disulfide interchange protein DsbE
MSSTTPPSSTPTSSPSQTSSALRRALIVLPAVLVLGALGWSLFHARPSAQTGRPAPAFSLPDVADRSRTVDLRAMRGRPVVVNFWASWCEPCKQEAAELAAVSRDAGAAVRFLGVNILDGRAEAVAYMREYGIEFPSARDASGRVAKLYGVTGVPETVFVGADGRMAGKYIGALRPGELSSLVRRLLSLPAGGRLDVESSGNTRPVP